MKFIIMTKKNIFFVFFFAALFYISSTFTMQNTKGDTTLFLAIRKKNYFMLKHYLEQGKDPNERYNESETPLFYVTTIKSIDKRFIQALLFHGADPNLYNYIGNTPLHNALANHRLDIVMTLLRYNANPTQKNKFGYSPLDLAREDRRMRFIGPLSIKSLTQAIENDDLEQAVQALKDGKSTFQQEDVNIAVQLAKQYQRIFILNKIISYCPYLDRSKTPLELEVPSRAHPEQSSHISLTADAPRQKTPSIKRFFKKIIQFFQ